MGDLIDAKDPVQAALQTLECVSDLITIVKSYK